ncbi:hypothetical protein ACWD4B_20390 [Streptomyces sp. NPDC002536]
MRTEPGSVVHVIAHHDDDLYFMNPDLVRSLQDGDRVTTIVVTAGEGDGINADTGDPKRTTMPPDRPGYSSARGCGLRSAYARMATGDRSALWHRSAVEPVPGFTVEHFTLAAQENVRLFFLNLCMWAPTPHGERTRLRDLWEGTTATHPTLVLPGSTVRTAQSVSREQLISALAALLADARPTVVRTMDPDPEHDGGKPGFVVSDHQDHTVTAEFALAALARYRESTARAPVVEHYRAYANRFWPHNLDSAATAEKAEYLATYAGLDATDCPQGICEHCGDRQLGTDPYRSTHMMSTALRYTPGTDWLRMGPGGRLNAYAVLGGRLAFWSETGPATGEWKGPFLLGDGWLCPAVRVAGAPGAPAHLVALHRQTTAQGAVVVDLVHTVQDPDGKGFAGWQSLENPDLHHDDPRAGREAGVPAVAADGTGRLHVFLRNFGQGISMRRQTDGGGWGPWEDLGGSFVQDGSVAHTTDRGTVELYVPGKKSVHRWHQTELSGPFLQDDSLRTGKVATGGITAVDSGGGRTCLYYREADTQQVMAYRQHDDGRWPGAGAGLGGHGGTGPVAAIWAPQRGAREAHLAHRSARGRLALSLPDRDKDVPGPRWRETGEMFTHAPSLAFDASGRIVAAAVGTDGRLHVRRQLSPAVGSPMGPGRVI